MATLEQAHSPYAVELRAVSKVYQRRRGPAIRSVDNLQLTVPTGQVLGVLGPNGAGKTTTIKMICGLLTPSAGEIFVHGQNLAQHRGAVMQHIGAVLEGTRNIYWRLSPWQNLMYFGRLRGCTNRTVAPRAEYLLRELQLWERRDDPVGDFSRGMQQKVAIAAALIHDPAVVLLDEPTLGLDVAAARTVKLWVKHLAEDQHKTILLTSHELDMVQEVCQRVAIIHRGQLIADKSVNDLLTLFRQDYYQIKTGTAVSSADAHHFPGLTLTAHDGGTLLAGPITTQATLYQILAQIHNLQLPLISVQRSEPSLEEVFVQLTEQV